MRKNITRDDERKLYEAYEVLDRLINGKSTFEYILNEKIDEIFEVIKKNVRGAIMDIYGMKDYFALSCMMGKVLDALDLLKEEVKNK